MANGIAEVMLYKREPLTVPAIEELLGKAKFRDLLSNAGYVKTEPGKPTIAPSSDKREAITRLSAAEAFKDNGGNDHE